MTVEEAMQVALRHHGESHWKEAEELYRSVLREVPDHPVATHFLGVLGHQIGRTAEALPLLQRSAELAPRPGYFNNLGEALRACGRYDEAIRAFERAIELEPDGPFQHNNLGLVYDAMSDPARAEACYRRAMQCAPNYAEAYSNLGAMMLKQRRFADAEGLFLKALELKPDLARARANLANLYVADNRLAEADVQSAAALQAAPNDPLIHAARCSTLMLQGRYAEGWPEYEWRVAQFPELRRTFAQPNWRGERLDSKTLLLFAEQGLGDTIQFARFVKLAADRGGRVVLECQRELVSLLKSLAGVDQVVARGDALPSFDVQCSLLSLPHLLGVTLESLPSNVPYLTPKTDRVAAWRTRLSRSPGMKVGIAWAGNPGQEMDRHRSCHLEDFAPFLSTRGVTFFGIQKGDAAREMSQPPAGANIVDVSEELRDFDDTAALMANLDLVISVCTAPAHLAGALGLPTWTLLHRSAEWRWLRDRPDSPWYPTMRLFRQTKEGDWSIVATEVAAALLSLRPREPRLSH